MRRSYYIAAFIALIGAVLLASAIRAEAITVCNIFNGCIGTSTAPAYGQLLVGGKNGEFEYVASSTLASPFSTTSAAFWLTQQSTSNLPEGSNLYFTNARAVSALTGQSNSLFTNGAGYLTSLAGAASSTALSDNNTFTGTNAFATTTTTFLNGVVTVSGNSCAAIQVAVDMCSILHSSNQCGKVSVSAGSYTCPGVTVPGVSNFQAGLFMKPGVLIVGASATSTILNFTGSAAREDGVSVGYNHITGGAITVQDAGLEDMTLNGGAISTSIFGSAVRDNNNTDFNNLTFKDLNLENWDGQGGIGIGLSGDGNSNYVSISNIYGTNIKRAVVWSALVDYLTVNGVTCQNVTGDPSTDEGACVEIESGFEPSIDNVVGTNMPDQILLLGGGTRGSVDGVRGTSDFDGIYLVGYDWSINDVHTEIGSSPTTTEPTAGIAYDSTLTPGQPNGSPVQVSNHFNNFYNVWIASYGHGIYINASPSTPSYQYQFYNLKIEGSTGAAVDLVNAQNFNFNGLQTLSNQTVFQLATSSVQVLSGNSNESQGAYNNASNIDQYSTLNIQNVTGQLNTFYNASSTAHTLFGGLNSGINFTSSATGNVAFGEDALEYATSTTNDVAIGYGALKMNAASYDSGVSNDAVGYQSQLFDITGSQNDSVGYQSMNQNQSGSSNVGIGYQSLYSNVNNSDDIAVGREALFSSAANDNIGIGYQAGRQDTSGASNISIGSQAMYHNTGSSNNTAVGFNALEGGSNFTATGLVGLGYQSGFKITTGANDNTFVGYQSGLNTAGGDDNTFLGYLSGQNNTSGTDNIVVGFNALVPSASSEGQLNIGNIIFGTGLATSTNNSTIPTSTGYVGINSTSPWTTLSVAGGLGVTASSTVGAGTQAAGLTINGGATTTGDSYFSSGTNSLPSISFSSSENTGWYLASAGNMDATLSGTRSIEMTNSAFYTKANSHGFFFQYASADSATSPTIIPDQADTTTGFAAGTQGNLNAIVGGTEVMRWTSGKVGIGTTTPQSNLVITKGANATTTVAIGELGLSTSKSCVNMQTDAGTAGYFYLNASGGIVSGLGSCTP